MNKIRHTPPGRTNLRPPSPPLHGSALPFLTETPISSGHDLLVLNVRPDLSPATPDAAATFLRDCFSSESP